jgi:acetyl-CoA carboxylase carboxyl transferase subunit beta
VNGGGRGEDWRDAVLAGFDLPAPKAGGRNPLGWPGYHPRQSVRCGTGRIGTARVVAAVWDFSVFGGTFGEREADAFAAGCAQAVQEGLPLVTFVRTGGTRLQEGMAALVGIPRAALALEEVAAAGLPHLSVVDHPTTGGIWIAVCGEADLRVAVAGATVGFSGPRVIEAMTGEPLPAGSHTAEGAYAAGLVDAVAPGPQVGSWLCRALSALAPPGNGRVEPPAEVEAPDRDGWAQVAAARAERPSGADLLSAALDGPVELRGSDPTVRAVVGRSAADRPTVGVALAAGRGERPGPAGFRLLTRAARTADRLGADLLTFVDTPGADPTAPSEAGGLAPAIGEALTAVLRCRSASLAVVHGEGGSGGALAAATTDTVLVTPTGYYAALGPEGAGSALKLPTAEAAARMGVRPADLDALGFATPVDGNPATLRATVAARLRDLGDTPQRARLAARRARWAAPLPGTLPRNSDGTA